MKPPWITLPWALGACPPFPENQAAGQEHKCSGTLQLGSPQFRTPTSLEYPACLGGWLMLLAHSWALLLCVAAATCVSV